MYHPHLHLVVTGGGLTEVNTWKEKEEDFFIPVQVMSRVFREKYRNSSLQANYRKIVILQ